MNDRKPETANNIEHASLNELLSMLDALAEQTVKQERDGTELVDKGRELIDDACERRKECAEIRRRVYQLQALHSDASRDLRPNAMTRRKEDNGGNV